MDDYVEMEVIPGSEANLSIEDFNKSAIPTIDPSVKEEKYVPIGVDHLKLIVLSAMFSLSIVSNGCSIVAIVNRKQKLTRYENL